MTRALLAALWVAAFAFLFWLLYVIHGVAVAKDLGQWPDSAVSDWFARLRQPDNPTVSCCGEADAYWADQVEVNGDQVTAIITDTRDDEPLKCPHVPVGTRIAVPSSKIKWDKGNPTGHVVIFLGSQNRVFCYVQNGGV